MVWQTHYEPPNKNFWQGRANSPKNSSFFQKIELLNLTEISHLPNQATAFALLGFCCDEGIRRNQGRIGAKQGPDALRCALSRLPIHVEQIIFYDAGNIVCDNSDLESAQEALGEAVALLLTLKITPIVIGGGHELAYGHYLGISKHINEQRLDIVNFDAHLDMRPLPDNQQGNSGTPFLQIANAQKKQNLLFNYHCLGVQPTGNTTSLLQTATQHDVNLLFADAIHHHPDELTNFLQPVLETAQHLYLTLCLDVFASPYAPGVSAPQIYGLTPAQLTPAIRQLAKCGKVISYDVAELSPPLDQGDRTAKLAAHFVFEIIHHHHSTR